jgi:hypothetical protein
MKMITAAPRSNNVARELRISWMSEGQCNPDCAVDEVFGSVIFIFPQLRSRDKSLLL